jgi:iron(III) transport system substrate-binding protein
MPTSWQDLAKPVYKGEVVMPSPVSSGTGYLRIIAILHTKSTKHRNEIVKTWERKVGH